MTTHVDTAIYCIRLATESDVAAVIDLRIQAEDWLAQAGIEQWTVRETGEQNIRAHISRGSTYVVEEQNDDQVIATLTLDGGDPDFWTTKELREPAVYLYKFIIDKEHRGSGLGDALLNWACNRARHSGVPVLRLDCWRTNTGLHNYYKKHGFKYFTTRVCPGRMSGALFTRPVITQFKSDTQLIDLVPPIDEILGAKNRKDREKVTEKWDDPDGKAAIFMEAVEIVGSLKQPSIPGDQLDTWNTALEQAMRALDLKAREIRQANGMYYRVLDGMPRDD